jgi:anti-sigma regulatory factor (Ser/Thr protein kinase)
MEEIVSHDNIGGYVLTGADNIVETVSIEKPDFYINCVIKYKTYDNGKFKDVHPVTGELLDHE